MHGSRQGLWRLRQRSGHAGNEATAEKSFTRDLPARSTLAHRACRLAAVLCTQSVSNQAHITKARWPTALGGAERRLTYTTVRRTH